MPVSALSVRLCVHLVLTTPERMRKCAVETSSKEELEAVYDLTRSDDALFFIGGVAPSRGARDDVLLGLLHGTAHHAPAVVVFDASGGRRSESCGGSGPRR